jgi:hypothetical protein
MTQDIESRLRSMRLEAPRDLEARALAAAAQARPRRRRLFAVVVAVALVAALLGGYGALSLSAAPPASAAGTSSGYGIGEGCWFVRDDSGLHFHIGGWYRGLPALCTSERR